MSIAAHKHGQIHIMAKKKKKAKKSKKKVSRSSANEYCQLTIKNL